MTRTWIMWVGVCLTTISLTGCSVPVDEGDDTQFTSNATAKEILGGQSWESEDGEASLAFDALAKLTELNIPSIADEVPGFNINGVPFALTVPADIPVVGGLSINVTLENTRTELVDGRLTLQFEGTTDQEIGIPLAGEFDHLEMTLSADIDPETGKVTNLDGSVVIVITVFGEETPIDVTGILLGVAGTGLDGLSLDMIQ